MGAEIGVPDVCHMVLYLNKKEMTEIGVQIIGKYTMACVKYFAASIFFFFKDILEKYLRKEKDGQDMKVPCKSR